MVDIGAQRNQYAYVLLTPVRRNKLHLSTGLPEKPTPALLLSVKAKISAKNTD